jgi:NAD(P)-dependent dehydrogenase (short-subunit alcohol dehydrogenase family)
MRVNCLLPTEIVTPMTGIPYRKYPMGIGEPADVANLAVFLLSGKAKWITGQNYIIDCASI